MTNAFKTIFQTAFNEPEARRRLALALIWVTLGLHAVNYIIARSARAAPGLRRYAWCKRQPNISSNTGCQIDKATLPSLVPRRALSTHRIWSSKIRAALPFSLSSGRHSRGHPALVMGAIKTRGKASFMSSGDTTRAGRPKL